MSFLKNKKVLILGLLSDRSIAYGIATSMRKQGAELAFTYQMDKHQTRVQKLASDFESKIVLPCDVSSDDDIKNLFPLLEKEGLVYFFEIAKYEKFDSTSIVFIISALC